MFGVFLASVPGLINFQDGSLHISIVDSSRRYECEVSSSPDYRLCMFSLPNIVHNALPSQAALSNRWYWSSGWFHLQELRLKFSFIGCLKLFKMNNETIIKIQFLVRMLLTTVNLFESFLSTTRGGYQRLSVKVQ